MVIVNVPQGKRFFDFFLNAENKKIRCHFYLLIVLAITALCTSIWVYACHGTHITSDAAALYGVGTGLGVSLIFPGYFYWVDDAIFKPTPEGKGLKNKFDPTGRWTIFNLFTQHKESAWGCPYRPRPSPNNGSDDEDEFCDEEVNYVTSAQCFPWTVLFLQVGFLIMAMCAVSSLGAGQDWTKLIFSMLIIGMVYIDIALLVYYYAGNDGCYDLVTWKGVKDAGHKMWACFPCQNEFIATSPESSRPLIANPKKDPEKDRRRVLENLLLEIYDAQAAA